MKYCDSVFIPEYRQKNEKSLLPYGHIYGLYKSLGLKTYREILKNGFLQYRSTKKHEAELKKILLHYKSMLQEGNIGYSETEKRRYSTFVYKYMTEVCVGNKALAAKMNISKDTVNQDIKCVLDKMMVFLLGMPALTNGLRDGKSILIRSIFDNIRVLKNPLPESLLCVFRGYESTARAIRKESDEFMCIFYKACEAYSEDLKEAEVQSSESRRRQVLQARLEGKSFKDMAAVLQVDVSIIYDISKENEIRLAEMIFQ